MKDQALQEQVFGKFSQVVPRLYRRVQLLRLRVVRDLDISRAQMEIISLLAERGGLTITEIANALFIAKPNITTAVDNLVIRNYVERVANPADQRSVLIHLSSLGLGVRELLRQRFKSLVETSLAGLKTRDLQAMLSGLDVLDVVVEKMKELELSETLEEKNKPSVPDTQTGTEG